MPSVKKMTPEQRSIEGAALRIRGLSRELRQTKEKLDSQLEINKHLHYDLHSKKMACDRVIPEQQRRGRHG